MASMFAKYVAETSGKLVIEDEAGFVMFYVLPGTDVCYLEDLYVDEPYRGTGVASVYHDKVMNWARSSNCKTLITSINTQISTPERSMSLILKHGFKFSHVKDHMIYFTKDIKWAE
jgi:GNAT superfamily N-acetyltransferase